MPLCPQMLGTPSPTNLHKLDGGMLSETEQCVYRKSVVRAVFWHEDAKSQTYSKVTQACASSSLCELSDCLDPEPPKGLRETCERYHKQLRDCVPGSSVIIQESTVAS